MTSLVTGAGGFTGSHLVRHLAARGQRVRAMVRTRSSAPAFDRDRVEVVEADLTNRGDVRRAVEGVDVIYNIAARYREAGLSAESYRAVNATAVGHLVEAARSAGARRVVQCSTVGVHGDIEHPPANEDAPIRPGDVYQETKVEGEQVGRDAAARVGMELVIARPTGIYGPGDRRLFKIFGKIAQRRFVMLGRGTNYYHVTYIDDLCEGFRLCAEVPAAAGRTYILGGREVPTLRELVDVTASVAGVAPPSLVLPVTPVWLAGALCEAICAPFGISPPLYRRRVDFFRKSRAFDIARARTELGFDPKVGLREGIGRTLEWYREQRWI
ncbi:MAG TPA: NAD-dependent epimerase/dehydratase family protein [Vicinamibacterales bacterium]|nr:NAD-dependent epimerase/dehydratase family protein [Vicinamibacterales bacterium]